MIFLAHVLNVCEDEMICDFSETYGVFNYKELPADVLATLCFGLRENSRVKLKLSGMKVDRLSILMASAVDSLNFLAWTKTKDSQRGLNRPKLILNSILGETEQSDVESYATSDEWEQKRKDILGD